MVTPQNFGSRGELLKLSWGSETQAPRAVEIEGVKCLSRRCSQLISECVREDEELRFTCSVAMERA